MATAEFDTRELRQVLGTFVTGVTIITTVDADGAAYGLTANSFSSVSLDPPLVLWSQSVTAPSHRVFLDAQRFVVNILAEDQIDLSNRFSRAGQDKFSGVAVKDGLDGIPIIEGCCAYLECRRVASHPGGDHTVFLGQVERLERSERRPLAFGGGKYMLVQAHDLGSFPTDPALSSLARLQAIRLATQELATLSDELDETLGLGVWGNRGPTILRWEESRDPVSTNLRCGLVLPVTTSATGLAFAAYLPEDLTADLVHHELFDDRPITYPGERLSAAAFDRKLDEVRAQGMATIEATEDFAALYGAPISALSVPVFDASGQALLTLTAIGHASKLDLAPASRLRTVLGERANYLSRRMGYQP